MLYPICMLDLGIRRESHSTVLTSFLTDNPTGYRANLSYRYIYSKISDLPSPYKYLASCIQAYPRESMCIWVVIGPNHANSLSLKKRLKILALFSPSNLYQLQSLSWVNRLVHFKSSGCSFGISSPIASFAISPRPFVSSPLASASHWQHTDDTVSRQSPTRIKPFFTTSRALRPFPSVTNPSHASNKEAVKFIQAPPDQPCTFILHLTQAELSRQAQV